MKPLLLVVFSFLPFIGYAQEPCIINGLPCYEHLWGDEEKVKPIMNPEKWKNYRIQIEQMYASEINFHEWRKEQPKDRHVIISAVVLTSTQRPFTVLEKYEYSWGGVFYFKDLWAVTEEEYFKLESKYRD